MAINNHILAEMRAELQTLTENYNDELRELLTAINETYRGRLPLDIEHKAAILTDTINKITAIMKYAGDK